MNNLTDNTMNNDIRQARAAIIATLNDEFRTTGQGGEVVTTRGVESLGTKQVARIEQLVRDFTDFTAEDDPHGEHDCGSFEYNGQFIYWKIDYYDASLQWPSEDPANPDKTTRVLTIMLQEEY